MTCGLVDRAVISLNFFSPELVLLTPCEAVTSSTLEEKVFYMFSYYDIGLGTFI